MARLRDAIDAYPGRSQAEKERLWARVRLVLIGGCRNDDDERRVKDLKVDSRVGARQRMGELRVLRYVMV